MVFSSFPAIYLDHPNLQQFQEQQHQDHHHQLGSGLENSPIQLPQPSSKTVVGGAPTSGASSIRPISMVDRARMAKLPLPEAGLKCPRCDSTNTKFCYFNNYSLSQPRHFCKTCRRYWTKNGALRNVPVGGGCRRNKKSKTATSKSTNSDTRQVGPNSTTSTAPCPSNRTATDMNMPTNYPHQGTQIPLVAALHNLNHYAGGPFGSSLGGFQANMGFSLGNHFGGGNNGNNDISASETAEPWRLPPIGGFEHLTSNLFPLMGEEIEASSSMIGDQEANLKSEGSQATDMTKQFHINSDHNGQYWNANIPWTGFSGLSSSSTSHLI